SQLDGRMARLVGLLLASGVLAAFGLRLFNIPVPYDMATLNLSAMLPGILLVTGMEELLFRQVMYRWLEQRRVSGRLLVLATALAFACAHFGPLVTHTSALQTFVLLQSFYMAWVGWLLGETRRVTNSWLMSWAGHGCYNLLVLTTLKFLS
ncbi:MAG: CPBP family intramembrane metalloprotease, partial [Sideroxydans sp.]|nr:CPBP family intramembrane metalloprotease [Sideroxydans sp.]